MQRTTMIILASLTLLAGFMGERPNGRAARTATTTKVNR